MSSITILIVEDEVIVALDIKNEVETLGYVVTDVVTNYKDALKSVQDCKPDLILMDINLKNSKNGIETAKSILKIQEISIIYLTAYSDDDTIQSTFITNPIGYITKPFNSDDLRIALKLATVKMNTNKTNINIDKNWKPIGLDYYIDLVNDYVYYKDVLIKFSSKEMQLLKILIFARGNTVTFKQIEYEIWPDYPVSDNSLRNLVHRLRAKFEHKLIDNVHGLGFKLILP